MRLGEKIKKRRKEIKMTQAELAEGICTQAMISRIEKKKVRPSRDLIEKVAERLDVSVHYFYGEDSVDSRYSKLDQLNKMIRKHMERKEYDSVSYLMKENETVIAQSSGEHKYFFNWIDALLLCYQDGDEEESLLRLVEIEKGVKHGDLRLEIIDSIGQLYMRKKEYQKAETYYKEGVLSFTDWMDVKTKALLLLHYVMCLFSQLKYEKSLEIVFLGLDLLVNHGTLYLLGDFFYYKGHCLEHLYQRKEAMDAYKKAYTLFDIQQNEKFTLLLKIAQANLKKQTKKADTFEAEN